MDDDNLRSCFAMFAMLKMAWRNGDEDEDASDCWYIADKMLEYRNKENVGIKSVKPKYNRKKEL